MIRWDQVEAVTLVQLLNTTNPSARSSGNFEIQLSPSPFHSQEININYFAGSLTSNITSHSMETLSFHSLLRWKMIILPILTTSHIFSWSGWENVLF